MKSRPVVAPIPSRKAAPSGISTPSDVSFALSPDPSRRMGMKFMAGLPMKPATNLLSGRS